jgi:DNA-binding transcriptional MerR regulator
MSAHTGRAGPRRAAAQNVGAQPVYHEMMTLLGTSDLANAVGVHPNTVRRYVERGYLPPVERSPSGYRRFTQRHLDCLRVAHLVYYNQCPSVPIRHIGRRIIHATVNGDLGGALELAHRYHAFVQSERTQADLAAHVLERWASEEPADATISPLQIGQVARHLDVTIDVLRNWDRNGLIAVPRDPANGYRRYGVREIRRLRVIRLLSHAGYSLSAILRMLLQLDRDETTDLRRALDTPRPDEDIVTARDRWISTLGDQERRAQTTIALLEEISRRQTAGNH